MKAKPAFENPGAVANPAAGVDLPADPWEWTLQLLALQTAWWSSLWSLQTSWLAGGAPVLAELPSWMVWHNGTEQLA